ncbi:MFS transporter [Actinomycetospora termitidis]|uniref:MFS transporter n=1 Tax=Actinomycetospora termitidis TaxID=3053470 RepID=A0ABT7M6D7_9PSEU|nr:MFS transporter [Actinomycetospora sp. Odt1-22]MDL5156232.1 MFS transporter [Actinomycetospora sp. Odt1-22]
MSAGIEYQVATEPEAEQRRRVRRAALAAYLGGTLEYYDFYLYGTAAAIVFPTVFFPGGNPALATISSFATLAVAYGARPFGALLWGHLGDRIGRKRTLVMTLTLMGTSTFLIGLLPTYGQVGLWAPVLLVLMRVLQGVSAGGETAGAASLAMEESPVGRRAFYPSFTMSGIAGGLILASLAFLPVAAMSEGDRFTWGWRIPFLASVLVLLAAFLVRRTLAEPVIFEQVAEQRGVEKLPVVTMLRSHPRELAQVALMTLSSVLLIVMQSFGLSFAVRAGIPSSTMLWVTISGNVLSSVTIPLMALLSDRAGRRPVFAGGILLCAALIWPFLHAIATRDVPLVFAVGILLIAVGSAMPTAVYPAFFAELFNVRVRYSGMGLGMQIGFVVCGITPLLATALVGLSLDWAPAAWIVSMTAVVAAAAALWARETSTVSLQDLGNPITRSER